MRQLTLASTVLGTALVWSCAYPEFQFLPDDDANDDDNSAAPASSSSSAGVGGSQNTAGAGGTSSTTSSSASGGAGPSCDIDDLGEAGVCGADKKCSIADVATGQIGCVAAGTRPSFDDCEADTECQDGTWCDPVTNVCKPFCQNSSSCDPGFCYSIEGAGGAIQGNIGLCTAHCDPTTLEPCGETGVSCHPVQADELDCFAAGTLNQDEPCIPGAPPVCAPNLYCDPQANKCLPWCTNVGDHCDLTHCCFNVGVSYDETKLGVCDDAIVINCPDD